MAFRTERYLAMVIKHPTDYQKGKTMVYFVRHGDRLSPNGMPHHPGSGLSVLGKQQAKLLAKEFSKKKMKLTFSIPAA